MSHEEIRMAQDHRCSTLKQSNCTICTWVKTYSYSWKSRKWWMRIYYLLLGTVITNAYILYEETQGTKKLTHQEFSLFVIEHLLACHNSRNRPSISQPLPAGCLQGQLSIEINHQGAPVLCLPRKKEDSV